MNTTFKGVGFGIKEWTVTEDYIKYKGENISYDDITSFNLITTPSTPLTNGLVELKRNQRKNLTLAFAFSEKKEVHEAVEFIKRKIDEANGVIKDYKFLLTSKTGSKLEVYNDYIVLYFMPTGNLIANVARGGSLGGKRINISDITSIQFREPTGIAVGFIQFAYPGSIESKSGVIGSVNDENSILVEDDTVNKAREIVQFIEIRREELKHSDGKSNVSVSAAVEIKNFKELLDMGIITEAEFEAKKKQLLGL